MSAKLEVRDLVVTRILEAPLEEGWKAWSDPEQVMRWWGPEGFTSPIAKMDFREGGTSLVCMRSPEGQDFYNTWTYRKIVPMRLIAFIQSFVDQDSNRIDPATLGLPPGMPQDVRTTVTFRTVGDNQTEMIVTEYDWVVGPLMELSRQGLEQCLDKLAALFAKD